MRLISIDTETTGASAPKGDRCVEIGAVELLNGRLTGRTFQTYLNPGRPVAWQAQRVHGLSDRFLADKPRFADVAGNLLDFIGDAPCFAHNARFDRDMILYDFLGAGLPIPNFRFFDSLPFAKAQVRAPAYKLDVLAQTLGVTDGKRGLHGALEDATILARVLEHIEGRRSGAIQGWVRGSNALSPVPNGWSTPAPVQTKKPSPPATVPSVSPVPVTDPSAEQREADRIADLVRAAIDGASGFERFAERLTAEGVLIRPVINGDLALHGVRFSTRTASITGGSIGLTGPAIARAGAPYRHAEHAALVGRLIEAHDAVMGPVGLLKGRFTAVPTPTGPASTEAARVRALVVEALSGAGNIWELAERLDRVGVATETRLDVGRMRVSSVLFVGEGARVPGPMVGLGPKDMTPAFWSLDPGPAEPGL